MLNLEQKVLEVADILKLISHPKRLLILCKLAEWEKIVSELERECTISQSQLSQFLTKMREDGMVESRKNGTFVTYRISNDRINLLLKALSEIYCH